MFFKHRTVCFFLFLSTVMVAFFWSCTTVKNYPKNKPFVFNNKINVEGDIAKDEKKRLEAALTDYWDDSLKVRRISKFGIATVVKSPNVYDSADISHSIIFMRSYLNSQGYYNTSFRDSVWFDTTDNQIRTTVIMNINPGKSQRIDSFAYDFKNSELQRLALENISQSLLAKNKLYTKQLISSELDRLVTLFRSKGYFNLTRENLQAVVDTADASLLQVTLDPFEQATILAEAAKRRQQNPTLDVVIRQRDSTNITSAIKYRIGNVYYYPEADSNDDPDSLINSKYRIVFTQREMTSKQNEGYIHFRPLREHTFLKRDSIYNEANYFKTVNAFTQLGAWKQVDVRTRIRNDSVPVLDFHFFLNPCR